ncbi:MAG: diguanylate cyclase [Spirochaetota bacterium]
MGLLEKAFEYKKEINRKGKATLIDTIKGPAETEMLNELISSETDENANEPLEDIGVDISDDLFELPKEDNYSPLNALKIQKNRTESFPDKTTANKEISEKKISKTVSLEKLDPRLLSMEDEPVFPRDIEVIVGVDKNDTKNIMPEIKKEIPEIEPYILSDDNSADKDPVTESSYELHNNLKENFSIEEDESEQDFNNISNLNDAPLGNFSQRGCKENTTLYEVGKEISRSESRKALFEIVIFSVMGQLGTSNASIMIKNPEEDKWIIVSSIGLKSGERTISYNASDGILKSVKKDITDIEDYRDKQDYEKYYQELSSTGFRLLCPWFYKGKVLGILALGNKITDNDYSVEDKDFIQAVCEASAVELNKINTLEKFRTENESSKTELDFFQQLDDLQEKIITKNSLKNIKDIIISEFEKQGITSFSVFINDQLKDNYIPVITGKEEIHNPELLINGTNPFIIFIKSKNSHNSRIDDFNISETVKSVFTDKDIKRMSLLWIFPFTLGNKLMGFVTIYKVNEDILKDDSDIIKDNKLKKFVKMIFSNLINIMLIDSDKNKYTDNIDVLFTRINSELENCKNLSIPLAISIFSIKNYKRYGNIFGYAKAKELFDNLSDLIKSRLSETDFSARYDRNKILIVFPGKDKKFAMQFSNTIRNEFMLRFTRNEMQLLITFLIAEYPEDGNDLLTLIDIID